LTGRRKGKHKSGYGSVAGGLALWMAGAREDTKLGTDGLPEDLHFGWQAQGKTQIWVRMGCRRT
jgi:hypothetical protein